jgi:hypothetical protein
MHIHTNILDFHRAFPPCGFRVFEQLQITTRRAALSYYVPPVENSWIIDGTVHLGTRKQRREDLIPVRQEDSGGAELRPPADVTGWRAEFHEAV